MLQIERHSLQHRQLWLGNFILALVCIGTAQIGFWLAVPNTPITVVWPPAGLALAALFRYGKRLSIGAWVGAFGASCLGLYQNDSSVRWPLAGAASGIIATGALAGLWFGQHFLERIAAARKNGHVRPIALLLITGLAGSALTALIGTTALYVSGLSPTDVLGEVFLAWWLSSTLGVFLFTPLLLAWWSREDAWHPKRRREALVCLAVLMVTAWLVFLKHETVFSSGTTEDFILLPCLTWAALRLGFRATTTTLVLVCLIAILSTLQGAQSLGQTHLSEVLFHVAAGLICLIPTLLCIAAVVRERGEAEALLQNANHNLEHQVERRTKSLKEFAERLRNEAEHQKQTAAALRESQERLELAIRAAQIGYWDCDLETQAVHFSAEWKAQLGYHGTEIAAHIDTWQNLLHPHDQKTALAKINAYLAGAAPDYTAEFRLRHKDGSYRWIYSRGQLLKDPSGKPCRVLGCHIDITERKQTEFRLEAFVLLGKQLSAATTVRRAAQLITDVAEPLLGWDAAVLIMFDDVTGLCRSVLTIDLVAGVKTDVLSAFDYKEPSPRMRRVMTQGAELILRSENTAPDGSLVSFGDMQRASASLMFVPMRDGGKTLGMLSLQSYRRNAYSPADLESLQVLADHCGGALARIRSREIQKESELNLATAQTQAKLGSWEIHFRTQKTLWSQGMFLLFERDPAMGPIEFTEFIKNVWPADRAVVTATYHQMADCTTKQSIEFGYTSAAGKLHHFALTLECFRDPTGHPAKATGVIQDITEQKEAEQALRDSSERLHLALLVARMGTWDMDLGSQVVHADERLMKMFGGPAAEHLILQTDFNQFIHLEDRPQLREAIARAIASSNRFHERFRVVWPDGSTHWLEGQGKVFRDPEGHPLRVVGVTVDITEKHQAEEALRNSEQLYAELVNNIDGIVWEADHVSHQITFISHQSQRILGYPPATWKQDSNFWQNHIHPDDRARVLSQSAASIARGADYNFEYRMIAADAREVWLQDFVTVVSEQGKPTTLRGVMVDISRRKNLEQEQARAFSLLQTTIESSEDGLLVVDRTNRVRIYNQRFAELWRLPADLLAQNNDQALLEFVINQLTEPSDFMVGVQYLYTHPERESFDVLQFKDGRTFERYSRPQRLETEIIGRVWSFRDVTERRSNERLMLGQTKILESIASGVPLKQTLTELCRTAETASPAMFCSVLLLDAESKKLHHGAAPSLPESYCRAIDGTDIGPAMGSCGTAVFREATVIVEDLTTDPLWDDFRHHALPHGLRACWSTPIFDATRGVLGTLAFYYQTPKRPTARDRRIIEMATHTAAIAILKHRSDEELARSAKILRQLSANLMEAQETERHHLARELHDELGQTLTATKIALEGLRHDDFKTISSNVILPPLPLANHPSLTNAISHVESMLAQVRNLSLSLRPPMLDDFGLPAALRWLVDQHTKNTGRSVTCDLSEYAAEPEPMLETACFRIAQEALTNISRHSQAQQVNVVLQSDATSFTLRVRDDGVGFDFTAAAARAHAGGSLGLLAQQERAALVGGRVEINSRLGAGTEVWARFPLPANQNNL